MGRTRKSHVRIGVLFLGSACALGVSCAGDEPSASPIVSPSDGGVASDTGATHAGQDARAQDASAPGDAGQDAGSPDAGTPLDGSGNGTVAVAACALGKPFGTPVPVSNVNSTAGEWSARLTADELTMFLTSERLGGVGGYDIWQAERASRQALFGSPTLVAGINGPGLDAHATVTGDGATLYLVSDRAGGSGNFDIWTATRTDVSASFGVVSNVAVINSLSSEDPPFIRADGKVLYMASNRGGNYDIYRAALGAGGAFDVPQLVQGGVNSAGDESFPVPSADELTIFFARGTDGGSSNHIWVAHRSSVSAPFGSASPVTELDSNQKWSTPTWLSTDGCTIYLVSDRTPTTGGMDIFQATRPN